MSNKSQCPLRRNSNEMHLQMRILHGKSNQNNIKHRETVFFCSCSFKSLFLTLMMVFGPCCYFMPISMVLPFPPHRSWCSECRGIKNMLTKIQLFRCHERKSLKFMLWLFDMFFFYSVYVLIFVRFWTVRFLALRSECNREQQKGL